MGEWLGHFGISKDAELPTVLENDDTWEDVVGQKKFIVKDSDPEHNLQVVEATLGSTKAVGPSATTSAARMESDAFIVKSGNPAGTAVTFEFWYRNGDLAKNIILFETGGTAYGASITIGDGDQVGDDTEEQADRKDDLRFRLGGSAGDASATVTVDLPNTADSEFVHVAAVYDGNNSFRLH